LVVPNLLHPFFAEVAKSLSEVLRQSGYYLIVSSSDEDPDLEEVEINPLAGTPTRHLNHCIVPARP
jgi:LacI family transcriptional regulator